VPPLSADAALQLFRKRAGQRPESVSEAVEAQVVRSCGGLPLALLITGGAVAGQTTEVAWMVRHKQPAAWTAAVCIPGCCRTLCCATVRAVIISCILFALWHACYFKCASQIDREACTCQT
jgi:hypothetical protein